MALRTTISAKTWFFLSLHSFFFVIEMSPARTDTRLDSPGEIHYAPPRGREISIQRTDRGPDHGSQADGCCNSGFFYHLLHARR